MMIGTILAIIIAFLLETTTLGREGIPNSPVLMVILIVVATLFMFLPGILTAFLWGPLQNSEQRLTPRVSELFLKDRTIQIIQTIFIAFPLLTYVMAIDYLYLDFINNDHLISLWIIMFGICLDAFLYLQKRLTKYLNPFQVVNMLSGEAQKSIQADQELELSQWIDTLSEVGVRAGQISGCSLCNHVNNELQKVTRTFLESAKSISHPTLEKVKETDVGEVDTVSYTLFFILQRLQAIFDKTLDKKIEPSCSNIITVMGKITIDAAKCDMTMPTYPLHFLGKFAIEAQKRGMSEIGPKAILTLLEVARSILRDVDVTYAELQSPFFSLIAQMNTITQEVFKQDKSISIPLLVQPFRDLKDLFLSPKMATHQDTPAILSQIDGVIGEYDALQSVLRAVPPIPPMPQELTMPTLPEDEPLPNPS